MRLLEVKHNSSTSVVQWHKMPDWWDKQRNENYAFICTYWWHLYICMCYSHSIL